jgi:DNA-binding NarL/FixJ family response regulator
MKILIVDDQSAKAEQLAKFISSKWPEIELLNATSATEGFRMLSSVGADIVLLDVVLPLNFGDTASEEGSLWFVKEVRRKIPALSMPFIVGTTQYADSIAKVQEDFRNDLWSIAYVHISDERWAGQIEQAIRIAKSNVARVSLVGRENGETFDIAILTALKSPEYSELVSALGGGGEQIFLSDTGEKWLKFKLKRDDGTDVSILAACVEDMGMTAMASLTTKVAIIGRPKILFLVGIMAGNKSRVGLSDLIIIESTWNFQAGKLTEKGFCPDISPLSCDFLLSRAIGNIIPANFPVQFWQSWSGVKPQQIAKVHPGDVACSPFVVADGKMFVELEDGQKRKILGLEMEAYGCYDAARRLGDMAPSVVCVKSVCDFGDGEKADQHQTYCAALSAAAVVLVIRDSRLKLS